jgi:hypothetical protein
MVKLCSQALVNPWSHFGQTFVKPWSNIRQTLVNHVKPWSDLDFIKPPKVGRQGDNDVVIVVTW